MKNNIPTLVVAIKTREIYQYHGDQKYENLSTGAKGMIADDVANKLFSIPVALNYLVMQNPTIIDLIKSGNFQLEKP
jgi:hypothetical protein